MIRRNSIKGRICPVDLTLVESIILIPDMNKGLIVTCRESSDNESKCPKGEITCQFHLDPEKMEVARECSL